MERLRLLTERPGEWAEVYSGTPSACHQAANALRLRRYWVPPGGWDFTVRTFRRGHLAFLRDSHPRAVLYARYLGPEIEPWKNLTEALNHSADAVWDQYGRRICPVCEKRPLLPTNVGYGAGSYPSMCDHCSNASAAQGIEHGTEASYRHKGCRCIPCRTAARKAHRARIEAGRPAHAAPGMVGTSTESEDFPEGNDGGLGAA